MYNEDDTLVVVGELRRKIQAKAINISWPSSETRSSNSPRKSKKKGPGYLYSGPKVYDPLDGDEFRHIDWNLTASEPDADTFIVRTFLRPRMTNVHVLLDVSPSMNLGTKGTLKGLLAAVCAGCGIESARKTKDMASFATYSYEPVSVLKVRNPRQLFLPALMKAVEDRDPQAYADTEQAATEAPGWLARARKVLATMAGADEPMPDEIGGGLNLVLGSVPQKRRNLVLLVSDFVNMNEDDWEALRYSAIKHETIAVFVQDSREAKLPDVPWPGIHVTLRDFRGRKLAMWLAPNKSSVRYLNLLRRIFGNVTTAAEWEANWSRHEESILNRLGELGINTLVAKTDEEDEAVRRLLNMLANKLRT